MFTNFAMDKSVLLLLTLFTIFSKSYLQEDVYYNASSRQVWSNCSYSRCTCGAALVNLVKCIDMNLLIQPCYCIFYDADKNTTVGGACLFSCFYPQYGAQEVYYKVKRYLLHDYTKFNEDMCNHSASMNRKGKFCGQCHPDSGLPVYSYDMSCTKCEGTKFTNWFKYLAIALGPLTAFYIVMVIFRASMPTSRLNGLVFVMQCFSSPLMQRVFHLWTQTRPLKYNSDVYFKITLSIGGWSNLDFFRQLYPSFCLDSEYNVLQVISLDLLVALYPFFLILCTSCLIHLHDKNCCLVTFMWKLLKRLFGPVLKRSVHVSLVETFAMFILFSHVKIIGLSFDLLNFSRIYRENGSIDGLYVFYDPSISYFGKEHLPYASVAIVSAFFFGFLPFLLLLLHPMRVFHRLLNCCNIRSQALFVFMDAFQGSYKIKPYDSRYFAAWYLFLRSLFLFLSGHFTSILCFLAASLVMILGALSVAVVKPYKDDVHTKQDIVLLLSAALLYLLFVADIVATLMDYHRLPIVKILLTFSILFTVMATLICLFWHPVATIVLKLYTALRLSSIKERWALIGRRCGVRRINELRHS